MPIKNWITNTFLILSLAGVLDALYLSLSIINNTKVGCFIVQGCDSVLKSSYSEVFGVPVAFLGLFYYGVLFLGFFVFNFLKNKSLIKTLSLMTSIGFLATLWFLYVQAFALGSFCSYCLISGVVSISLFILGMYVFKSFLHRETSKNN